ncbi:MAG: glutathione S-transferase [Halieaceae bacterium]|jgi:glutathione S-transferase
MQDPILHHYEDSPFSEKMRALLGFKKMTYSSVEIPVIMPKPQLTALTGGYRRTPVMQSGADIYCDTALITQLIEKLQPSPAVTGLQPVALASAAARWTDNEFFRVCVGLVFQPRALAANPRFNDPGAAEAFIRDRAELTAGSKGLATPLPLAEAVFRQHMSELEITLQLYPFLAGEGPGIVDFSTWHCCWFVARQEVLADYFAPFPTVRSWMERMRQLRHGAGISTLSGEEAVAIAAAAQPAPLQDNSIDESTGLSRGQSVQVMPTDYGFQPVSGSLLAVTDKQISVARSDDRAGAVHVHFPRYGFEVNAAT